MADTITDEGGAPVKSSKMPLILGLSLALGAAGGSFYLVQTGLLFGAESQAWDSAKPIGGDRRAMPDIAYVPIESLVISLGDGMSGKHLRFRAELEVAPKHQTEVEKLMPRIVDVLNSYLRAVEVKDLTDKAALVRLRAQMLRRLQVVTGNGRINDLLIMEFVMN